MRKNALVILLAGFAFAYFTVPLGGTDLLIDAVGWLLVWNAVRALHRVTPVFGLAAPVSLALVAVSALDMFFTDFAVPLGLARTVGELLLLLMLMRGLLALLDAARRADRQLLRAVFALNMLGSALQAAMLLPAVAGFIPAWAGYLLLALRVALLAELLRLAFLWAND